VIRLARRKQTNRLAGNLVGNVLIA